MPTVTNKTQRPLSIPLPRGKTLHLGPGKSGEVAPNASAHPSLKALVEAGEIELRADAARQADGVKGGKKGRMWIGQASGGGGSRRSGDR